MRLRTTVFLSLALHLACGGRHGADGPDGGPDEDVSPAPMPGELTDMDGDTIYDVREGFPGRDTDGDGLPDYLDDDSDDDCLPDRAEAGDLDPATSPVDSDGDGFADFEDPDSDNDGLPDHLEDTNCNGEVDVGETSWRNPDSDNDEASDLVENAAGTDPADPNDNPQVNGHFVFVVPYADTPRPTQDNLLFATEITRADVVFALDTSGSMGGELNRLKQSLATLATSLASDIPSLGLGVVSYEDFPTLPYGNSATGDQPFRLIHRVMTTSTEAGLSSVQQALNNTGVRSGSDLPESGWEMLYQLATGGGTSAGGASVPPFISAAESAPEEIPEGEEVGTLGGAGFRLGSLPIVVWVTDATNHNTDLPLPLGGDFYADIAGAKGSEALAELAGLSARLIGVRSSDDPVVRYQMDWAIKQAGGEVPPAAWGESSERPSGCAPAECCTGIGGAGVVAPTGICPLHFAVDSTGYGLGRAVESAIKSLVGYAELDIRARVFDDPTDEVDAAAEFIERIAASPADLGCGSALSPIDTDGDGSGDLFPLVRPGASVCYQVVPRVNTTVPATSAPQLFRATITVTGDDVADLDTRDVYFVVPPVVDRAFVE